MLMSIAQPFARKMCKHMLYTPSSYRSGAGAARATPVSTWIEARARTLRDHVVGGECLRIGRTLQQ